MPKRMRRAVRYGRVSRLTAAVLLAVSGLSYMVFPATQTSNYFEGTWVSIVWGFFIACSGVTMFAGIKSQVLQLEQLGVAAGVTGMSVYTVSRALMATVPFTPARIGLAALSAAFVVFLLARYFELGADIRSSKLSRAPSGEGGINV